jgi:hypothetical protein
MFLAYHQFHDYEKSCKYRNYSERLSQLVSRSLYLTSRKFSGLILGLQTNYTDWDLSCVSSDFPGKFWD